MSLFGLDPESVVARLKSGESAPRAASLASSIGLGGTGFAVIALAAFGVWAWGGRWLTARVGELGLYAICCVLFIGGGGWWFSRFVVGLGNVRRFCGLFAAAFFLYAAGWTVAWVVLRNRSGEWLGSLLGTVLLGCVFASAFGATRALAKVILVLFVTHSAGYFLGSALYSAVPGLAGQLLWGVAYGLGFGAGIGWAIHLCQEPVRRTLEARQAQTESGA
ncbi:MAG: hypothetical protein HYY24_25820 [Verrucomicrobia bacterium]|nr:hypothetical protein [Verrucomicrobiota bacterium]